MWNSEQYLYFEARTWPIASGKERLKAEILRPVMCYEGQTPSVASA